MQQLHSSLTGIAFQHQKRSDFIANFESNFNDIVIHNIIYVNADIKKLKNFQIDLRLFTFR